MSLIHAERQAREARKAAELAPLWTGAAWRVEREGFKAWFRAQCAREGVAFDACKA